MSAVSQPERWPALDDVLALWSSREILSATEFYALKQAARARAGSLARIWETRFIQAIYDSIGTAMRENLSSAEWMTEAQKLVDAYGGGEKLNLYLGENFTPWYAETVFRTNVQAAFAAGRYADLFSDESRQMAGYWMFSAIRDDRNDSEEKCPGMICRELDGKVFRKDDGEANRSLPPLHFNCRCTVIELDQYDVDAGGYEPAFGSGFSQSLKAKGVWSDDKVTSLLGWRAGIPGPMSGVDVTGTEPG